MNAPRQDLIRQRLQAALAPTQLHIDDDSHLHTGHAGATGGAGHYRVAIVSPQFTGLRALARHQLVYRALADMMPREIHALSINAQTPEEASRS